MPTENLKDRRRTSHSRISCLKKKNTQATITLRFLSLPFSKAPLPDTAAKAGRLFTPSEDGTLIDVCKFFYFILLLDVFTRNKFPCNDKSEGIINSINGTQSGFKDQSFIGSNRKNTMTQS